MTNMLARAGRIGALRRGLVVLAALLVGVMVLLSVTRDEANLGWAWWSAFLAFGLVWLAARSATGNVAEGRADRLDERELLQRYRASRIGWTCLVVATLAVGFTLTVVADDPVLVARGGALLLSVVAGGAAVPTMLLFWAAPEPGPEDEDD